MRKFLLTVIFLCCCVPALRAQEAAAPEKGARIDEIIIETRTSFHQQLENGVYDSHFQGEYLNLRLAGRLTPDLTFFIRQRFNRKIDDDNPFSATDHLWLRWQASPKWSFTAGKQPILIG
ncbi:MAG: hypothetical protein J6Y32_07195, partial [Bacteroidales bacterium]|nr:hypothetical protein [Bacteroidales bacterium]